MWCVAPHPGDLCTDIVRVSGLTNGARIHVRDAWGTIVARKGEARMEAVACWNSVMDENPCMVQKWNEFVAA